MGDKTKKHLNNVHYLGEPCKLALETIAGNVPRDNFAESIIGQVDVCPRPPPPAASTGYGCRSTNLIHHNIHSDVCPAPNPLTLQHNPRICSDSLLAKLKVANGDMNEIVASILSPP